jgi:hypothetical protein
VKTETRPSAYINQYLDGVNKISKFIPEKMFRRISYLSRLKYVYKKF